MWYLAVGLVSYSLGALCSLICVYRARNRLCERLEAARLLLQTQRELENRRVAYDSGREHLARSNGGKPARISDGMATKPGTLSKYLNRLG